MTHSAEPDKKLRLRRMPTRGLKGRDALNAILDAQVFCHVGFEFDGYPVVIPTLFWREGETLYWHGSAASRMIRAVDDREVCVTVTLLDGMVLARSAYHHSANYRSAMIFGRATLIRDAEKKLQHLRAMMDSIAPDRFTQLRPVRDAELKATIVVALPIEQYSVKSRTGDVSDDDADLDWPVWAGVIPLQQEFGTPVLAANGQRAMQPPKLRRPRA